MILQKTETFFRNLFLFSFSDIFILFALLSFARILSFINPIMIETKPSALPFSILSILASCFFLPHILNVHSSYLISLFDYHTLLIPGVWHLYKKKIAIIVGIIVFFCWIVKWSATKRHNYLIYLSRPKQSIGVIVMSKENSTTKSSYNHLSAIERGKIEALHFTIQLFKQIQI